jgi:hypothetical protein
VSASDAFLGVLQDVSRISSHAEVLVLFALVVELFTPRRNLILLVLYGQLLRVGPRQPCSA